MKLFYFNPNTYGEEAFVAAETKDDAIVALKKAIRKRLSPSDKGYINERMEDWEMVSDQEKIKNMTECRGRYTIDEFPVGHVVFTEIS